MVKFAPTYMTCYDGPEYSFGTLTLSAAALANGAAAGVDIGTIGARADATDSVLSIVDANGLLETNNRFQLNGVILEAGSAAAALVNGTYDVIIRETNPWVEGQYQDKTFTITISGP